MRRMAFTVGPYLNAYDGTDSVNSSGLCDVRCSCDDVLRAGTTRYRAQEEQRRNVRLRRVLASISKQAARAPAMLLSGRTRCVIASVHPTPAPPAP